MPLLDLIWVMLVLFLFVAWILVIVGVVTDIFRSDDLSGIAKAAWVLFVIVIPWLGVIVYLIARGDTLTARYLEAREKRERKRAVEAGQGRAPVRDETVLADTLGPEVQWARVVR